MKPDLTAPSPKYHYDPSWVAAHYDRFGAKEWDRLTRSIVDEVSLHLQTDMLEQFLLPSMEVLEIGAGAGRFTQVLATLGCRITVADISSEQLRLNKQKAVELDFTSAITGWHQLDICDLSTFPARAFDAVVCYGGPLSYVFEQADQALAECRRVVKEDGLFLSSVMSLWGTLHRFLGEVLHYDPEVNQSIVATGDLTPETPPGNKHYCHLYRSFAYRSLLERHGFEILEMSASNCLSVRAEAELATIRADSEQWTAFLALERAAARSPGALDAGTHLIAACRAPAEQPKVGSSSLHHL